MIYMMLVPRRNNFDLFDDFFGDDIFTKRSSNLMKTDIREKKDKYVIEMDLPGYEKENINISLGNEYLVITGKVVREDNSDEDDRYVHQERFYGECSRKFYVGDEITDQDISAEFKNGILKIEIPKKEEQIKDNIPKQIEIK